MRILWLSLLLLFTIPAVSHATAPSVIQQDPGAELWNAVRARAHDGDDQGQTRSQVKGVDSTSLINVGGEEWRHFRMGQLIPLAAKVLGFTIIAILLFRLIRGKIRIQSGRSTQKIKRFTRFQRYVHWTTAILFVALGITGAVLMFGRFLIIPYIGPEIGGPLTFFMKRIHDFAGPAFAVALVVLTFTFMKGNFAKWVDVKWVFKGGGMLGGHASAGRYNAGEKGWYWMAVLVGIVVVASGMVLDFPFILDFAERTRDNITFAHWIHSISAVGIMAASLGHIYMGTIAMEGAFEAMQTGECDANWAKEHHDLWYEELVEQGVVTPEVAAEPEQANDATVDAESPKAVS